MLTNSSISRFMVFAAQSLIKLCEIADYRPKKKSSKRKKGEVYFTNNKGGNKKNNKNCPNLR